MQSNLKEHLKKITTPLHEWLEEGSFFFQMNSKTIKLDDYSKILLKFYSFLLILEPKIKEYETQFKMSGLEDIDKRLEKIDWLENDLRNLGLDLKSDQTITFNTLNSFDSVVGALYVMEGSTMGGMQIVKMLQKNFDRSDIFNYYKSYESNTMPMWLTYSKWLNETKINKYEASLGACEVFIKLKGHLEN